MRRTLTTLLSAGAISAFAWATPALAQTFPPPFFPFLGGAPAPVSSNNYQLTVPSHTGAPTYSWHNEGPWQALGGQCQIVSGNRVCTSYSAPGPFGL
jgi:hypothetical protein